jgi:hypothetical protein
MLQAARLGCELNAVVITGGERATSKDSVPNQCLMAELLVLLEVIALALEKVPDD